MEVDDTEKTQVVIRAAREQRTQSNSLMPSSERLQQECLLDIIQNYLRYYAAGESHTARAKRYDLQHFLHFLAGDPKRVAFVTVEEWTLQRTKDFVDDRLSLGEAPATVSRRLATIKHFGRTLAERVHGYVNPAREVKSPVIQASKPDGLSEGDIALLQQAAIALCQESNFNFTSVRNKMLLEMLLGTGLRADEVRLLLCSQLSEDLSWLKNVKTKGRKFRNVYVESNLREALQQYFEQREQYLQQRALGFLELSAAEKARFPVFVSCYRAQLHLPKSFGLSPKSIWRIVSDFGKRASSLASDPDVAMRRLHPHRLRHTFAHGLLDSSRDVRLVAQALGHSDVRTTMRYTERTDEQLAAAIEKRRSEVKKKK